MKNHLTVESPAPFGLSIMSSPSFNRKVIEDEKVKKETT